MISVMVDITRRFAGIRRTLPWLIRRMLSTACDEIAMELENRARKSVVKRQVPVSRGRHGRANATKIRFVDATAGENALGGPIQLNAPPTVRTKVSKRQPPHSLLDTGLLLTRRLWQIREVSPGHWSIAPPKERVKVVYEYLPEGYSDWWGIPHTLRGMRPSVWIQHLWDGLVARWAKGEKIP